MGKKGLKFRTKLYLLYILLVMILLGMSFGPFYYYLYNRTLDQTIHNLNQLNEQSRLQLDEFIQQMDNTALSILADKDATNILFNLDRDLSDVNYFDMEKRRAIASIMFVINGPNNSADRISFFDNNGEYLSTGILLDDTTAVNARFRSKKFSRWYGNLQTYSGRRIVLVHTDDWSSWKPESVVSVYREVRDFLGHSYGFIEVQRKFSRMADILRSIDIPHLQVELADPRVRDPIYRNQAYEETRQQNSGHPVNIHGNSKATGWTLTFHISEQELIGPFRQLGYLIFGMALVLGGITATFGFFAIRMLTKPLIQLSRQANNVNMNSLAIVLPDSEIADDEIGLINRAFRNMFEKLKISISETVQVQTQEAQAHLKALQSQMNPHFLHNVLAVISAEGQDAGSPKIMEICHKLSQMLRYVSNYKVELVPLRAELEFVLHYMELMKERYEKDFVWSLAIRGEDVEHLIPKVILQPLIENCFQHAFMEVPPVWRIDMVLEQDSEGWSFTVEDNGKGMEGEAMEVIRKRKHAISALTKETAQNIQLGGMGLSSIFIRLHALYGNSTIFEIEHAEQGGVRIRIGGIRHD